MKNGEWLRELDNKRLAEFLITSPEMEFQVCALCEKGNLIPDDRGICLAHDGICDTDLRCKALLKWLEVDVCVMPEMPYCPACDFVVIEQSEETGGEEWICTYER